MAMTAEHHVHLKDPRPPLEQLSRLLLSEDMSDIAVVVEGPDGTSRRFPIHKVVLGSCSPYWKALLYGKKSVGDSVTLDNIDGDVFETVLRFGYLGVCDVQAARVVAVMSAAIEFQMDTLVTACVDYVEKNMTVDLCCDVLGMGSSAFPVCFLQPFCRHYLLVHIPELASRPTLLKAMSEDTLLTIVSLHGTDIDEYNVCRLVQRWCCAHAKDPTNKKEMADLHAPFIPFIRFFNMEKLRITSLVRTCALASDATLLTVYWKSSYGQQELPVQYKACVSSNEIGERPISNGKGNERARPGNTPRDTLLWDVILDMIQTKPVYFSKTEYINGIAVRGKLIWDYSTRYLALGVDVFSPYLKGPIGVDASVSVSMPNGGETRESKGVISDEKDSTSLPLLLNFINMNFPFQRVDHGCYSENIPLKYERYRRCTIKLVFAKMKLFKRSPNVLH